MLGSSRGRVRVGLGGEVGTLWKMMEGGKKLTRLSVGTKRDGWQHTPAQRSGTVTKANPRADQEVGTTRTR